LFSKIELFNFFIFVSIADIQIRELFEDGVQEGKKKKKSWQMILSAAIEAQTTEKKILKPTWVIANLTCSFQRY
jgi:hypothetical protein